MSELKKWGLAGLAAGSIIGIADAAALVFGAREMFFDVGELARTAAATIGLLAGVGMLAALLFAPAHWWFTRWTNSVKSLQPPLARWAMLTCGGVALLYPAFWQLTAGPQASQISGRPFWVLAACLVCALGTAGVAIATPRYAEGSPRRALAVLLAAISGALLLHLIDLHMLVRLYPVFHSGLSLVSLALLTAAFFLALRPPSRAVFQRIVPLLIPVGIAAGAGCAAYFGTQHNARFVASERTATASDLINGTRHVRTAFAMPQTDTHTPNNVTIALPSTGEALGPAFTRPGANVVLLSVDAMRFDRLAVGGATRQVAPNLDALAQRSVVFTRAYTPTPHTSYAISSLMTGKFTRPLFDVPGAPAAHETWPEILHRFRYETAAFFTRAIFFIDKPRFKHYWDTSYGFSYRKVGYDISASERVDQLITYLNNREDDPRPYFAWAHFFEPHEPYDPSCLSFGKSPVDRYDCEIHTVDRALKRLLDHLEAHSPNTIVIVLADHGEEFQEHGGNFHGTTLYDEQIRVPLLFHIPGIEPRTVDAPVTLVDVLGTVLSILDLPIPARVRSQDLSHLILGAQQKTAAFAEAHSLSMALAADHKLICTAGENACRLYDLKADPAELKNLAGRKPSVEQTLRGSLEKWQASHANYELRPVRSPDGDGAWPKAIRDALAGRPGDPGELVDLLGSHDAPAVRHKTAELLFGKDLPAALMTRALNAAHTDPVVKAWLLSADARLRKPGKVDELAALQKALPEGSTIWRRCALTRLAGGDVGALDIVTDAVLSSRTPLDERLEGIALLETHGNDSSAARLLELMNNYQVTLATARVFSSLRYRPAVEPMLTRLARERFPQRRAAFIEALSTFPVANVHRGIAAELLREELPPEVLGTLHGMNLTGRVTPAKRLDIGERRHVLLSTLQTVKTSGLPERIGILRATDTTEQTFKVLCGDQPVSTIHLPAGLKEEFATIAGCEPETTGTRQLKIVDEQGMPASGVELVAVVVR